MNRRSVFVFCPRGLEQQKFWEDWADTLREQGQTLDVVLECYDRRDAWVEALTLREGEAGVLGAACTIQDLEQLGLPSDIDLLDGLVQRGFPVLACSRRTLEEEPLALRTLCERQWKLLNDSYAQRL
jgi:hypothetical protein